LAVVLALGVFLVWSMFAKQDEPAKPAQTSSQTSTQPTGSAAAPTPGQPPAVAPIGPPGGGSGAQPAPAEAATISLPLDRLVATFSSACGGLTAWKLTDERYQRDTTRGELLPAPGTMTVVGSDGKTAPLLPTELANLPACGAFDVNFVTAASSYFVPRGALW